MRSRRRRRRRKRANMAALMNGADCGPVNPLKSFSSRLEQDRGVQRDRHVAGPSRPQLPFRALPAEQRFVPLASNSQKQQAFDLTNLERALSPQQQQLGSHQPHQAQAAPWARDFNGQIAQPHHAREAELHRAWHHEQQMRAHAEQEAVRSHHQGVSNNWATDFDMLRPSVQLASANNVQRQHAHQPIIQQHAYQSAFQPQLAQPHQYHPEQLFHPAEAQLHFPPEIAQRQEQREQHTQVPDTELANAAASLLATMSANAQASSNPKLANSQFMQLMKEFASGDKIVDGDEVLDGGKGKGKATAGPSWTDEFERSLQSSLTGHLSNQMSEMDSAMSLGSGVPSTLEEALNHRATAVPGASTNWEDAAFDADELETFLHYNGAQQVDTTQQPKPEWTQLQDTWDTFEVGPGAIGGVRQVDGLENGRYLFQSRNPHLSDAAARQDLDTSYQGLLEHEAAVQADPRNVSAWYNLGLKQQENERDESAILAFAKVLQLDPTHRPAQLALAVSYTNEGQPEAAQTSLEEWVRLADGSFEIDASATGFNERHSALILQLVNMARATPEGQIDADVQVALGVLFNTSNEYDKAQDCFLTALAVRPDDWLLYNRLGATMANSGRPREALEQYHRALALHPSFVRALYNMSIALNNLGEYKEAARRVLDALRLQQADATEAYSSADGARPRESKGVTSSALWNTLRNSCMFLNRQDLMESCTDKDLSAFNNEFNDTEA